MGEESLDPGGTKGMEEGGREREKVRGKGHQTGHCAFHVPIKSDFFG